MIALLDYGAGNLTSVRKAFAALGAEFRTPRAPEELAAATGIIVPGVGHFAATAAIDDAWRREIQGALARGAALLGICLGMQWLYRSSAEAPGLSGLGIFDGSCQHLADDGAGDWLRGAKPRATMPARGLAPRGLSPTFKIPHVGWNSLDQPRSTGLMAGVTAGSQVYFTHSYVAPLTPDTVATTSYGRTFAAAVERDRIAGVQFHPEKSGDTGLHILRNWIRAL